MPEYESLAEILPAPSVLPTPSDDLSSLSEEDFEVDELSAYDFIGGKPFHGFSCECPRCLSADALDLPREGELPRLRRDDLHLSTASSESDPASSVPGASS